MNYEVEVIRDLEEVVPMFQLNRHNDIRDLKKALSNGNTEKIRNIGHALKGVGSGYGFHEVTNIGREIEIKAKAADLKGIENLIKQLEDYLEHVKITYVDED